MAVGVSSSFPSKSGANEMAFTNKFACFLALAGLSTPALADVRTAAYAGAADRAPTQTSMFAGATFRLGFDRKAGEPRHRASLGFTGMARNPGAPGIQVGQGLELSLSGSGRPALYIGGSDAGELWKAAKMSGGGKAALIVGGTAAVLGIAALVAYESLPCQDDDDPCD